MYSLGSLGSLGAGRTHMWKEIHITPGPTPPGTQVCRGPTSPSVSLVARPKAGQPPHPNHVPGMTACPVTRHVHATCEELTPRRFGVILLLQRTISQYGLVMKALRS